LEFRRVLFRSLPLVARQLVEERPLPVNDFIVRDREDERLAEGVHQGERKQSEMIFPVYRLVFDEPKEIVHPTHVPLEVESQATSLDVAGNAWPCGGLFGDHERTGEVLADANVELTKEVDRLQVLSAAIAVGKPLSLTPGVVEVEHGRDGVHTKPI